MSTRLDDLDPAVLTRYVAGTGTDVDRAIVDGWLAADVRHSAQLELLQSAWLALAEAPSSAHVEASLASVLTRTGQVATSTPHLVPEPTAPAAAALRPRLSTPHSRPRARPWARVGSSTGWRWGAVAAALVAVGAGAAVEISRYGADRATAVRQYVTGAGQRLSVTLVDGTQFTLAPASRLRVPIAYGSRARDLELDGEAYFAVVHDAARPFAVHVRGAVARDIGTGFDVRAYGVEPVQVAVVEGEVAVGGSNVRAGDVATVGAKGVTVTHADDVAAVTAWTHGTLAFRDATLASVVAAVARWYDVDIRIPDQALNDRRLTAEFRDAPLDQVLGSLAVSVNARYVRTGRVITFTRGQ